MFRIGCLYLLLVYYVTEGQQCNTPCEQGHYCSGKDCIVCPDKHFRIDKLHYYASCLPWTRKPPNSHYVIAKNGTAYSDVEWRCADGYVEEEFAVESFHCVYEPPTTPLPSISSTTETLTVVATSVAESITTKPTSNTIRTGEATNTLPIVLSIVIVLIIAFVAIYLLVARKKKWWPFRHHIANGKNGTNHISAGIDDPATEPMNPQEYFKYSKYFLKLVTELGDNLTKRFLNILEDPSGKFNANSVVEFESKKTSDSKEYLTRSLVNWATVNGGINIDIIQSALDTVGRPNLLEQIENAGSHANHETVKICVDTNGAAVEYTRTLGAGDENQSLITGVKSKRPDRFKFFYNLASNLENEDAIMLLRQLPVVGNFNAHEWFKKCSYLEGFDNNFARTLEEWWQRFPDLAPENTVRDVLEKLDRNAILGNGEFRRLFNNLTPAKINGTIQQQVSSSHEITRETENC